MKKKPKTNILLRRKFVLPRQRKSFKERTFAPIDPISREFFLTLFIACRKILGNFCFTQRALFLAGRAPVPEFVKDCDAL